MGILDKVRIAMGRSVPSSIVPSGIPTTRTRTVEIGASGTENYSGFIQQDYLSTFHGSKGIDIFEEMRKSDATVSAVLLAMKLPILSADWRIDSTLKDDAKAEEIADFVSKNLFEGLESGWDGFLREALAHLDFGYYYFEKVHEIRDGQLWLKKLAPRPPSSHYRWKMESDGNVPGVTQMLKSIDASDDNGSVYREIPMWKLVLFSNNREGDNYEGVSVLRTAYKHWFFKNTLYRIDGIKHERGAGILHIGLPGGSSDDDRATAEELGRNFRVCEQSYIVTPSPDWKIELMTDGIKDQSTSLIESVRHHDRMIVMTALAQFLALGSSDSGSYALSKDQTSFFTLSIRSIANYMAGVINKSVIKELVDVNFGPQESYPKLVVGKIGDIDFKEFSEALEKLDGMGMLKKSPSFKVWVAKTFGLPNVTEEDFEDEAEEAKSDPVEEKAVVAEETDDLEGEDDDSELSEKKKRNLTLAESRVRFAEIERGFDDLEGEAQAMLDDATDRQREDLLRKVGKIVEDDDLGAVSALMLLSVASLGTGLKNVTRKALETGKLEASREIGITIPETPAYVRKVIDGKLALQVEARSDRLLASVKIRLLDWLNNDIGKTAAIAEADRIFRYVAAQHGRDISSQVVVDAFNEGRAVTFGSAKSSIHGLQRSEILDRRTCPTCISLDGRVLGVNDPFTMVGQIHSRCRGIWVAILKTDAELPETKVLPRSILSRFETVSGIPTINEYKPMKSPLIGKRSRAQLVREDGGLAVGI